jgi:hypothetical protein
MMGLGLCNWTPEIRPSNEDLEKEAFSSIGNAKMANSHDKGTLLYVVNTSCMFEKKNLRDAEIADSNSFGRRRTNPSRPQGKGHHTEKAETQTLGLVATIRDSALFQHRRTLAEASTTTRNA